MVHFSKMENLVMGGTVEDAGIHSGLTSSDRSVGSEKKAVLVGCGSDTGRAQSSLLQGARGEERGLA